MITVTIINGRLGSDPTFRTAGSHNVGSVSLASNNFGQDNGTTWLRCNFWGKHAELLEKYLGKGSTVSVSGELECRKWTDKEGNERESWEVNVKSMQLPPKSQNAAPQQKPASDVHANKKPHHSGAPAEDDGLDDLPF